MKRSDATDPASAAAAKTVKNFANALEEQSNLSRKSGGAMYTHLAWLFPDDINKNNIASYLVNVINNPAYMGLDFTYHDSSFADEFGPTPYFPLDRPLGADDRPTDSVAQFRFRNFAVDYCALYTGSYFGTVSKSARLFQADDSILLDGETLPADPVTRTAFAAARNGWLHPYSASSDEVQALATLYSAVAPTGDTSGTDPGALRALCLTVLTAPQFWVGSQLPLDSLRKVALEIGRRVPTFREMSDYLAGKLTLRDYTAKIQTESGYLAALRDWHKRWLVFYWDNGMQLDNRPSMAFQGNYLTQQAAILFKFDLGQFDLAKSCLDGADNVTGINCNPALHGPGHVEDVLARYIAQTGNTQDRVAQVVGYQGTISGGSTMPIDHRTVSFVKTGAKGPAGDTYVKFAGGKYPGNYEGPAVPRNCDITKDQAFDPRTVELVWEQWNGSVWEKVGGWKRKLGPDGDWQWTDSDPTKPWLTAWQNDWVESGGSVTVNGQPVATTLADFGYALSADFNKAEEPYAYQQGALQGLNFYASDRRVRRFAPDPSTPGGEIEQDGTSWVTFPITGARARVCNSLDRFVTTCALRPNTRNVADFNSATFKWTPETIGLFMGASEPLRFHTLLHPALLDSFKCGTPDMGAMANIRFNASIPPWQDAAEAAAWPFGYSSMKAGSAPSPNNVALFVQPIEFWEENVDFAETADDKFPETITSTHVKYDIAQEPFRLINDIVTHHKDYRLLLTANYTFGGEYYERLLRTQGYYLPGTPSGFTPSGNLSIPAPWNQTDVHPIIPSTFPDMPIQALESVAGTHSGDDSTYMADLVAIGHIAHKTHSGILTMPAFLNQYTPAYRGSPLGLRTLADRVFSRLLCGSPAMFPLNTDQAAVNARHAPPPGPGSSHDHLDPTKGCFVCHANLDPMAAIFSANFTAPFVNAYVNTGVYSFAEGEMRRMEGSFYYQGANYGIRGGGAPATGAFLGREITGIAALGETIAASREFHKCAAQKAMEQIFGRTPAVADMTSFSAVVNQFTQDNDYDAMIQNLVSMPGFAKGN